MRQKIQLIWTLISGGGTMGKKIITEFAMGLFSFLFVLFLTCFVLANGVIYACFELIILCIVFYVVYLITKKTNCLKSWEYYFAVFVIPALINVIIAIVNWYIHNGIAYETVPVGTTEIIYKYLYYAEVSINNVGYYFVVLVVHMIFFGIVKAIKKRSSGNIK